MNPGILRLFLMGRSGGLSRGRKDYWMQDCTDGKSRAGFALAAYVAMIFDRIKLADKVIGFVVMAAEYISTP